MADERDAEIAALRARLEELERAAQGDAEASSHPGPPTKAAAPPDAGPRALWIIGGVILVIALIGFCSMQGTGGDGSSPASPETVTTAPPVASTPPTAAESELPVEPISAWTYDDRQDPMTDALTRTACTTSTNQAYLSSPYRPTNARLCIRQSPQHGLDAYVYLLGDGQIICRSYSNCTVPVRFGDGAQQQFSATEAADGSSDIVFLTNASRFVAAASGTDIIRVQLTFYRDGDQVLEFPSADLEWPRPAPPE